MQPDILYVATAQRAMITSRGIEGPPTLVVEVLSPSTMQIDRGVKLQLYARYGVPYYWIGNTEARVIEAHRLAAGTYDLAGRLSGLDPVALPPFSDLLLPPAALWE